MVSKMVFGPAVRLKAMCGRSVAFSTKWYMDAPRFHIFVRIANVVRQLWTCTNPFPTNHSISLRRTSCGFSMSSVDVWYVNGKIVLLFLNSLKCLFYLLHKNIFFIIKLHKKNYLHKKFLFFFFFFLRHDFN